MKQFIIGVLLIAPAFAHRLDEYLQAATLKVEKNRIHLEIHLTPGVAVLPAAMAAIDTDRDGLLSTQEQQAYGARVLADLKLSVDGKGLDLHLDSVQFPSLQQLHDGLGDIAIELTAAVESNAADRLLVFDNHHQNGISVYLVNCLSSRDPDIRITAQDRNYTQSHYELRYQQGGSVISLSWLAGAAIVLLGARLTLSRKPA